jgi:hypothetical protein
MAEAQKMMNDPAFQAHMNKVMASPAFKSHMSQQQEVLKDPKKVKELEKQMQDKLKEGNTLLEEAQAARAKLLGEKGDNTTSTDEAADKKNDDDDSDDKKKAAVTETAEKKEPASVDDEDDMPDMPNLNLN